MLDELTYGNLVEIEGESVESIRVVAGKLNLNWDSALPTSYHMLFERLCAKHPDLDPKELSLCGVEWIERFNRGIIHPRGGCLRRMLQAYKDYPHLRGALFRHCNPGA